MAGGKETPRQKMIGMMYLVLTALLALNVQREILDAFVLVNDGLETTIDNFEEKNADLYADFAAAKTNDPGKFGSSYEKALQVQRLSDDLDQYVNELKIQLIMETEGVTAEVADTIGLRYVDAKDNTDIPTNIMIGQADDGEGGMAHELRLKIEDYKAQLLELLDQEDRAKVSLGLSTEGSMGEDEHENWEIHNFYDVPLAPDIVLLSKIQTDIKNAEYDIVSMLLGEKEKESIVFDTVLAKVVAPTSYVLLGEEYKADVFVAAYSTTQMPEMLLGDVDSTTGELTAFSDSLSVKDGIGQYAVKTDKEGTFSYSGVIKVKNKRGDVSSYPFESQYIVARPSATVSPMAMNVFYKGLDNPVAVSVPGVANENVQVSISGGNSIRRSGDGQFVVKLSNSSPREVKIRVSAVMANGDTKPMGEMPFRVKNLPKPYASVNGKNGGEISKSTLMAAQGIRADYGPDFLFDLTAKVTSFRYSVKKGTTITEPKIVRTNRFESAVKELVGRLRSGDKLYLDDVRAKGDDGVEHKLGSMTFTVRN